MLLVNLDGHELRDAPGISQRVDNVFGRQFAHGQCQVALEGCLDGALIDPLDVFRRASTTNQLHQKFCVLHSLLCCLEGSAGKGVAAPVRRGNAYARNRLSTAGESDQPIVLR